jgi:CubicO group peptidase (beta-lactamase class C family)
MLARLVLACTALASCMPARPKPAASPSPFEAVVLAEMTKQGVPGVQVAIADRRSIVFSRGFGFADLENRVPVGDDTVFRLASVSKPLTAVGVLQLAATGRIDLDAPVQTYVPDFPPKPWPITARQLLAHVGGIRHYKDGEEDSTRHYDKLHDGLAIFAQDPLVAHPGTKYLYSSYGYNLLGCIVEGASGQSYVDYMRAHVFAAAGMDHVYVDDVFAIIPKRAQGYQRLPDGRLANSGLADTSYKIPSGGWATSAAELARFGQALEGGRLLDAHWLQIMLTPPNPAEAEPYALGLHMAVRDGRREAWHNGGQQRVRTNLYLLPDAGITVALASNLEHTDLLPLARRLADMVIQSSTLTQ